MATVLVASTAVALSQAPGPAPAEKAPEAPALRLDTTRTIRLEGEGVSSETPTISGNRYQVGGAVAEPLKRRGIGGFFRGIGNLFNPFAPVRSEPRQTAVENVSPRAWTTMAGWHPGASAFPDATTHEPQMALVSVSSAGKK
jgi:hypothetical protein